MLIFSYSTNKYNISTVIRREMIYFSTWRDFYAYCGYILESVKFKRELFGTKFDIPLLYIVISKQNNKNRQFGVILGLQN